MSRLCAACHKVQSLTQHIHHCESCDLVSTILLPLLRNKSWALCRAHHTSSGSLYMGTKPLQKWGTMVGWIQCAVVAMGVQ